MNSTKFVVYVKEETTCVCSEWLTKSNIDNWNIDQTMMTFMAKHFELDIDDDHMSRLYCETEMKIVEENGNERVVRCHPNYRNNGPWHDWGLIHLK